MRTTITLEPDVERRLKQLMAERGLSFKVAVNAALRDGLGLTQARADVDFPSFDLGAPLVDLTHANRLSAALEDDEVARELEAGR